MELSRRRQNATVADRGATEAATVASTSDVAELAGQVVTFELSRPPRSKKNRRRIVHARGRPFVVPSREAIADAHEVEVRAAEALARISGRPWGEDAALSLELVHDVASERVTCTVRQCGVLLRRGRRGSRQDSHETIAEALDAVVDSLPPVRTQRACIRHLAGTMLAPSTAPSRGCAAPRRRTPTALQPPAAGALFDRVLRRNRTLVRGLRRRGTLPFLVRENGVPCALCCLDVAERQDARTGGAG